MDAEREIHRLLSEHSATLIRQGNHNVYAFPNGLKFTLSKTPSDRRTYLNELSQLKRVLGIRKENGVTDTEEVLISYTDPTKAMEVLKDENGDTDAVVAPPHKSAIQCRIEQKISELETERSRHLSAAQSLESQITKYGKMLIAVDDPDMLEVLEPLIPADKPKTHYKTKPKNGTAAAGVCRETYSQPPNRVGTMIQVTRALVLAATQTFRDDEEFNTNDVFNLMVGDTPIDNTEKVRIRSAVSQALVALRDRGKIVQTKCGLGHEYSRWKKVDVTKVGKRVEV